MSPSNAMAFLRMYTDPGFHRFARKVMEVFRPDPRYSQLVLLKILVRAIQGERIVRFGRRYVLSSYLPPFPSPAFMTFLKGAQNPNALISDLAYGRRRAPLTTHLCITAKCDYQCLHCSAHGHEPATELDTRQWTRTIARFQDLGIAHFGFTGGEPLLRDDLEQIVRSVDGRSTTTLYTNGHGLTADRARRLKAAGLFAVSVSLDSADPARHNHIRGHPEAFDHALAALRNAARAGLYPMALAVVFKEELSEARLFRLFRLAKTHGAREVRLAAPLPSGRLLDDAVNPAMFLDPEDKQHLAAIQQSANRRGWRFPKISSVTHFESDQQFGCNAGNLHCYVTAGGEFCPCDYVLTSFGNVTRESIGDLYARMQSAMGRPSCGCRAAIFAEGHRNNGSLPIPYDETRHSGLTCRSGQWPGFFRDLQTY